VKLLLDTHAWLWLQTSPERLGSCLAHARNPQNTLLLSAASSWEIAIKWAIGRLELPEAPGSYVPSRMILNGVEGLPVYHRHALEVASLPRHHSDPFDRLLVAQARVEGATLITADRQFQEYDVELMWAN
jgi:PIN domain nuclease of toxin-antitoxin system